MENYRKKVHRVKKNNLTVLVNEWIFCGSLITWKAQLPTRGPHALTEGPSVQVQFPHLKISTLTTAYCRAVLLSIRNDLPQKFIDKAILSFPKRLRSCAAAAGGHFEDSVKYRDGSCHSLMKRLKCWRKSCAKLDSLLLNIRNATACSVVH